jgi:hypothetical protein
MTSEQTTTTTPVLVFKDGAGDYFLVPQDVLERGRGPDERTAELEQIIAAQGGAAGDDTGGYIAPLILAAAFSTGFALGFGFGPLPDVPGVTTGTLKGTIKRPTSPPASA